MRNSPRFVVRTDPYEFMTSTMIPNIPVELNGFTEETGICGEDLNCFLDIRGSNLGRGTGRLYQSFSLFSLFPSGKGRRSEG
jgi:hypothetical protein